MSDGYFQILAICTRVVNNEYNLLANVIISVFWLFNESLRTIYD